MLPTTTMLLRTFLAPMLLAAALPVGAETLAIADRDGTTRTFTRQELLPRATSTLTVPDALYGKPMTYRVIAMKELLKDFKRAPDDYLAARAADGFTVPLPGRLLDPAHAAEVEAFLAIEDPAAAWEVLPDNLEKQSAGPFYIVWKVAGSAYVSREYWSAQLAGLKVMDNPIKKWPHHEVAPSVPAADRIRTGLDRYVSLCITCHKLDGEGGAGAASGPDLRSAKALDTLTLKKWIRDPKSVRATAKMPKFDDTALSDGDLDALIAWLTTKAGRL